MLSGTAPRVNCGVEIRSSAARLQALRYQRQRTQSHAARIEDGVGDRRGEAHHRAFARAYGWNVLAVEQNCFENWNIAEARDAILRQPAIQNLAVVELDRLEKRSTQ